MKTLFPGHYRPDEAELRDMMHSATVVLDSSTLLNLYRYPRQARADFLNVLRHVETRLWIPHQVALEFQENRLSVIADQVARFKDVRDLISGTERTLRSEIDKLQLNKRHSSINPNPFLKDLSEIFKSFLKTLDRLERAQPDVFHEDQLRSTIDRLFDGRIGAPPPDQAWLDNVYSDGNKRYQNRVPPGYMDADKSEGFQTYMGLMINRQYGDLILWTQLIEACKSFGSRDIIFVTDDDKEDWWWMIASKGRKIVGPRPELIEEIKSKIGQNTRFYMYNSERFMSLVSGQFGIKISEQSVEQVRDIARLYSQRKLFSAIRVEEAVKGWIEERFGVVETGRGFPDLIGIDEDGESHGFEVITARSSSTLSVGLKRLRELAARHPELNSLKTFTLVIVMASPSEVDEARHVISRQRRPWLPDEWRCVIGFLEQGDPPVFTAYATM